MGRMHFRGWLRPKPWWLVLPVLAVCLACVGTGGYFTVDNLLLISAATTAEGEIVSNRMQWRQGRFERWRAYFVSVEFTAHDDLRRSVESVDYYYSPMPVGESVPVYYLPEDPVTARIGGKFLWTRVYRWAAPGVVGLVFFSSLLFLVHRRTKHNA